MHEGMPMLGWTILHEGGDFFNPEFPGWRGVVSRNKRNWVVTFTSRSREGYDFTKNACDTCSITREERDKKPAMLTGIDHPEYYQTRSFSLGADGSCLCPECAKEASLKSLFALTDAHKIWKGAK